MTLVQYMAVGSVVVGICSDTRQVVSGKLFGIDVKFRHEDTEEKSGNLSNYVLFGGGGLNSPVDRVKELIAEYADGAQTLDGIVPAFKKAIETMRYEKKHKKYVKDPGCFQVLIGGFTNDGHTGRAVFTSGKNAEVEYEIHEYFQDDTTALTPSDDELEIVIESLKTVESAPSPEVMVGHFARVQKACFLNDDTNVSEKSVYTVIYRDPNTHEFKFYKGTIDLLEGSMK
ncbi:hypothetical protein KD050_18865 [Psychrobacillus sp. INOP01]|uniref:hypothetical protein n=1 Tax=Psychrobacillus sp. INOP01 TaxID=2829187 RepID=UPI001BAE4F7D|nr:hypothetical protein [Psychrobacillus sp. INOP01]QUG41312.1 hypothetical protein KD050_18865 [Psychrobacillus sp. INOP01]